MEKQPAETPADEQARAAKRKKVRAEVLDWVKTFAIALALALVIRTLIFTPVRVLGSSMKPTLIDGQIVIATRFINYAADIERGDVVIFHPPETVTSDTGKFFVKRVIGLPGDCVRIEAGLVYINGELLEEDYIVSTWSGDMEERTVPEGEYFVMGDNRGASTDSRDSRLGTVPKHSIRGKVTAVLMPFADMHTIREPEY